MLACAKQPAQRRQATRQAWLGAAPGTAEGRRRLLQSRTPASAKHEKTAPAQDAMTRQIHARLMPGSIPSSRQLAAAWFLLYCLTLLDVMMVVLSLSKRGPGGVRQERSARRERGRGVLGAWYAAGRKTTAGRTMSTAGRRVAQHGAVQSRPHWT